MGGLGGQRATAGGAQLVVAAEAAGDDLLSRRSDQPLAHQPVEGGIKRARPQAQAALGQLFNFTGDPVAVQPAPGQGVSTGQVGSRISFTTSV